MPKTSDFVFSANMFKEGPIKAVKRKREDTDGKIILSGDSTDRPQVKQPFCPAMRISLNLSTFYYSCGAETAK